MSELALRLIAENKKTKAKTLDLGNCGLTVVPEEVGALVWLEELILSGMWDGVWKEVVVKVKEAIGGREKSDKNQGF